MPLRLLLPIPHSQPEHNPLPSLGIALRPPRHDRRLSMHNQYKSTLAASSSIQTTPQPCPLQKGSPKRPHDRPLRRWHVLPTEMNNTPHFRRPYIGPSAMQFPIWPSMGGLAGTLLGSWPLNSGPGSHARVKMEATGRVWWQGSGRLYSVEGRVDRDLMGLVSIIDLPGRLYYFIYHDLYILSTPTRDSAYDSLLDNITTLNNLEHPYPIYADERLSIRFST